MPVCSVSKGIVDLALVAHVLDCGENSATDTQCSVYLDYSYCTGPSVMFEHAALLGIWTAATEASRQQLGPLVQCMWLHPCLKVPGAGMVFIGTFIHLQRVPMQAIAGQGDYELSPAFARFHVGEKWFEMTSPQKEKAEKAFYAAP